MNPSHVLALHDHVLFHQKVDILPKEEAKRKSRADLKGLKSLRISNRHLLFRDISCLTLVMTQLEESEIEETFPLSKNFFKREVHRGGGSSGRR